MGCHHKQAQALPDHILASDCTLATLNPQTTFIVVPQRVCCDKPPSLFDSQLACSPICCSCLEPSEAAQNVNMCVGGAEGISEARACVRGEEREMAHHKALSELGGWGGESALPPETRVWSPVLYKTQRESVHTLHHCIIICLSSLFD